jgi:hypothetical protein
MKSEGALRMRFLGMAESIAPMCYHFFLPLARCPAFRSGRYQGIGHAGKNMPCPSSAMSSGRLFLDGLLASIAHLRFTGIISIKLLPLRTKAFIIER